MSTDQKLRTALRDAISSDAELDIYEGATFEVASVRTIHLADTQLIACHVPPGRVEWKGLGGDVRLFWMSRYNGQFHYLGKDMHLLETGNFDSDGQTDALFMLTREGADAYLLAYDALTKTLLCETSYH